jgi:LacI family transcriptional regulator
LTLRVLAAAAKLDYRPNISAQAVARGASSTVALLVSDIADPYFSSIAAGVIEAAEAAGLVVTMAVTARDADRELALVRTLRGQRHKVLILAGSRFSGDDADTALTAELEAYESTGGRVVLISQHELPFDTVMLDNRAGGFALAERLVELGYRRFGAIAGVASLITSNDRLTGFSEALATHGITIADDAIARTAFTRDGGYEAARQLLARGVDDLEVVFAVNDVMAVGAMSAFREAGVDLPGSLAIAGYDDIATARDVTPALSTVRVPLADIGREAMKLALLPREAGRDGVITISSEVVLRESTPGAARA